VRTSSIALNEAAMTYTRLICHLRILAPLFVNRSRFAEAEMVQAQPADLASEGNNLLLVEGVDDWHAFHHIVRHITNKAAVFEIGYCGNDTAVLDRLSSVVVGSGTAKSILGAVLDADADTGVKARMQSIRHSLESAYDLPDIFPLEGLIIKPKDTRADWKRLPVIGVWLMPDNERDGIFEDLLCTAMPPESQSYISRVVDKAREDQMAILPTQNVQRPSSRRILHGRIRGRKTLARLSAQSNSAT